MISRRLLQTFYGCESIVALSAAIVKRQVIARELSRTKGAVPTSICWTSCLTAQIACWISGREIRQYILNFRGTQQIVGLITH